MSSSSLRVKFRRGLTDSRCSTICVTAALSWRAATRRRGYSVQQAAWMSGYQHATNFSTAFRRRYGVAPSEVRVS
ncbi:hypothetical protein CWS02_23155 [Enterobacter sp. EA-1]|nr:hypothetical protein CWS02_23155 [Enterobacter sp. EA-1]